jgi:hypothetical protein
VFVVQFDYITTEMKREVKDHLKTIDTIELDDDILIGIYSRSLHIVLLVQKILGMQIPSFCHA